MAPLFRTTAQWAVAALALVSNVQAHAIPAKDAARVPLRLMPLGASITEGLQSSDKNGYRKDLHDMLVKDGYTVDMVGSRKAGDMDDNEHEGWPGLLIADVYGKAELSVPSRQPNLFTINAGTNDCVKEFELDKAGERMDAMIEYLWDASPNSTVILSTLLINLEDRVEERVKKVNKQFRDLADSKAKEGKRIVLAEMHASDGPQKGDMADNTHPGDGGYLKMAKIWHRSIEMADSKGFLKKPNKQPEEQS